MNDVASREAHSAHTRGPFGLPGYVWAQRWLSEKHLRGEGKVLITVLSVLISIFWYYSHLLTHKQLSISAT